MTDQGCYGNNYARNSRKSANQLTYFHSCASGVRDAFNVYSVLEIIPVGRGQVRIRGVETGTYLAMNSNGTIYGSESANDEETVFLETTSANYFLYKRLGGFNQSPHLMNNDKHWPSLNFVFCKYFSWCCSKAYAHLDWYLGIKRNGQTKNGEKTWYPWGQKAVLFVHRKPFMEIHPLKQLRNRHGFTLTISVDGKVKGREVMEVRCSSFLMAKHYCVIVLIGTREDFSKESVLEFTPSNPPGAFRIRGVASRMYLAMDSKGRLYAEKDRLNDNTLFTEHSMVLLRETANHSLSLLKCLASLGSLLCVSVGPMGTSRMARRYQEVWKAQKGAQDRLSGGAEGDPV